MCLSSWEGTSEQEVREVIIYSTNIDNMYNVYIVAFALPTASSG